MKRRDFLRATLTASGSFCTGEPSQKAFPDVKTVLILFKCHFDLGFIDTQAGVMRRYFEEYYPRAIQIAQSQRAAGRDRYVWTTGSWLLYEYLEQANRENRRRMEQAVGAGDIAWHALPFSWQTELLDRSMIEGALGLSQALDRRFGRLTTGAKMTDVPGHTRGLISPLAERGVTFLDIGVNSASTPPEVPSLFVWKDAQGNSLVVMYHQKEYGGVVRVPDSDLAVAVAVRDDNSGPHPVAEINQIYSRLRQQFPKAAIQASTLTEIAQAVAPLRNRLPVVTQEIGDTWIYGVPSDPVKVARYRELVRLRRSWIRDGQWKVGDASDLAFLRRFALAAEHTWGTDTKTWLDFNHYTPHDLAAVLNQPKYKTVQKSWAEKRNDLDQGIATLPPALREQATLRLAGLKPTPPDVSPLQPCPPYQPIEAAHFTLTLDPQTGAIRTLRSKATGRDWASAEHPLALFAYQTLSQQDYDRFLAHYVTSKADWAPKDFGKPNIEHFGARSRTWHPKLTNCWFGKEPPGYRLVAELQIDDAASERGGLVAWPSRMYLEALLPDMEPVVHLQFSWFGKTANRLPEALWLTFQPNAPAAQNWRFDKTGQTISPFEVVSGGNRHMHSLGNGLQYKDAQGNFSLETLDAPVVAFGERSPISFSKAQPDLAGGIHVSLFNNGWGTNYIQWFGEDMRFRFTITA